MKRDRWLNVWRSGLVFLVLYAGILAAGNPKIDIVLDIDGVLLGDFEPRTPPITDRRDVVFVGDRNWKIMPGAMEFVASLARDPDVRLHLWSSRGQDRNLEAARKLVLPDGKTTLFDAVGGRIYSSDQLNKTPAGRFKDLRKISPAIDLNQTILVDDETEAIYPTQKKNHLWAKILDNNRRLVTIRGMIDKAMEIHRRGGSSFIAALDSVQVHRGNGAARYQPEVESDPDFLRRGTTQFKAVNSEYEVPSRPDLTRGHSHFSADRRRDDQIRRESQMALEDRLPPSIDFPEGVAKELKAFVKDSLFAKYPPDEYFYIVRGKNLGPLLAAILAERPNQASNMLFADIPDGRDPKVQDSLEKMYEEFMPARGFLEGKKILVLDEGKSSELAARRRNLADYMDHESKWRRWSRSLRYVGISPDESTGDESLSLAKYPALRKSLQDGALQTYDHSLPFNPATQQALQIPNHLLAFERLKEAFVSGNFHPPKPVSPPEGPAIPAKSVKSWRCCNFFARLWNWVWRRK